MDHEDLRRMCLPESGQESSEQAPSECVEPAPAAGTQSVDHTVAGGFSAPTSPAASELFSYLGSGSGNDNLGQHDRGGAGALAAATLAPQLPTGVAGPRPPWMMPETAPPPAPAPLSPPPPTSVAPIAEAGAEAEIAEAGVGTEVAEAVGIGALDVLAPLALVAGGGAIAYSGYKATKDPLSTKARRRWERDRMTWVSTTP